MRLRRCPIRAMRLIDPVDLVAIEDLTRKGDDFTADVLVCDRWECRRRMSCSFLRQFLVEAGGWLGIVTDSLGDDRRDITGESCTAGEQFEFGLDVRDRLLAFAEFNCVVEGPGSRLFTLGGLFEKHRLVECCGECLEVLGREDRIALPEQGDERGTPPIPSGIRLSTLEEVLVQQREVFLRDSELAHEFRVDILDFFTLRDSTWKPFDCRHHAVEIGLLRCEDEW